MQKRMVVRQDGEPHATMIPHAEGGRLQIRLEPGAQLSFLTGSSGFAQLSPISPCTY